MESSYNVAVPVKLDAFVLNRDVCDKSDPTKQNARIAPIGQPNYTFLRFRDHVLQSDVLDPLDMHSAQPSNLNSRITDLGTGATREHRLGVYLHWIMPRPYRSLPGKAPDAARAPQTKRTALDDQSGTAAPSFPNPPTRWLVVRKLDPSAPTTVPQNSGIPAVEAWVVESDRVTQLGDITDPEADLQVDFSPYINSSTGQGATPEDISVNQQAEIFIGYNAPAGSWQEDASQPRVQLPLLNSSNQLFPDYQPHNSNVFSFVDRFQYGDDPKQCLTDALADYYVIGWHAHADDDPFGEKQAATVEQGINLGLWSMAIKDPGLFDTWINAKSSDPTPPTTRTMCHGAMYGVEWHDRWNGSDNNTNSNRNDDENNDNCNNNGNATTTTQATPSKRPANMPGDVFSDALATTMPVAVGTTPTDALLAYVTAHHTKGDLADDIYRLRALLRAQDDSIDGQRAGEDEVQNYNFSSSASGTRWVLLPSADGKPIVPPTDELAELLRHLNRAQYLCDCAQRAYQQSQSDTFSLWWKYVTDMNSQGEPDDAKILDDLRDNLTRVVTEQTAAIVNAKEKLTKGGLMLKAAAAAPFSQQKDPTIFIGNTQAGWPSDFLQLLSVRLDPQIPNFAEHSPVDPAYGVKCLPTLAMQNTASALVAEFLNNKPPPTTEVDSKVSAMASSTAGGGAVVARGSKLTEKGADTSGVGEEDPLPPTYPTYPPLYHDQVTAMGNNGPWRDRWESTQPWFPLFVEWEVEYFHIPFEEHWVLDETTARQQSHKRFRYAVPGDLSQKLPRDQWDARRIGGRILLLPQPTYSLKAQIQQLFASTPLDILERALPDPCKRQALLDGVLDLPFVSSPLDGMTNHLATRLQGSHLKPNARVPGQVPGQDRMVVLNDAWQDQNVSGGGSGSVNVGIGQFQCQQMGLETNITPYGTEVVIFNPYAPSGSGSINDTPVFSPFKPVGHGQFRFSRLDVVDKFGQVACAIDPAPRPLNQGPPASYPCISEYYEPQVLPSGFANTVVPPASANVCGFAQLPPQITQPARLNASFVVADKLAIDDAHWRPATEWENPIWGWLVVNYVDNGIQFFKQDGTFYRELRVSAASGNGRAASGIGGNPTSATGAAVGVSTGTKWLPLCPGPKPQTPLQLDLLIDSIVTAGDTYLETFMDMITAAVGDSTAAPSAYSQFAQCLVGKPLALVNVGVTLELASPPLTNQSTVSSWKDDISVIDYNFPFKLGDHARQHDGLVGYFKAHNATKLQSGSELNLADLYTSFVSVPAGDSKPTFLPIDSAHFSTASFERISPELYTREAYKSRGGKPASHFEALRNSQLTPNVFGCILDPFQALNIYSAILPVAPLTLPPWTWETALKDMTAFFHFGPLVITDDVPKWADANRLLDKYLLTPPNKDQTVQLKNQSPLTLPALKAADWSWLQPYVDNAGKPESFMALSLGVGDERPRFQKGPYTVIEGYLQMKAPIQPNIDPSTAS